MTLRIGSFAKTEIRNLKRVWVDLVCSVDRREVATGRALVVPPEDGE